MATGVHKFKHRTQGGIWLDIRTTGNKSRFMRLHLFDHVYLALDALRTKDHAQTTLSG